MTHGNLVPRSLQEGLAAAASRVPEARVSVVSGRRGRLEQRTFSRLYDGARGAAARLHALGVGPSDRILMALPTSFAWLETWWGALLLGAWPVAVPPAKLLSSSEAHVSRIDGLVQRFDARVAVCTDALVASARKLGARALASRGLALGRFAVTAPKPGWRRHRPDPDEIAYLQLTSGSTGVPRAVMLSHRSVLHNVGAIDEMIGRPHGKSAHLWAGAYVSWLPLHHDMGLVGCLLNPMIHGVDVWLSDPGAFMARPGAWLRLLGRGSSTITTAPNHGYQWTLERASSEDVDLSGWRVALVGAEPVIRETTDAFARAFGPRGFEARGLRPCYGLAEATLAVTMDARGAGVRSLPTPSPTHAGAPRQVVCTGEPLPGTELRIVSSDGVVLDERLTGEIQVRGPGTFAGYYDDPEATAAAKDGDWLRTGDLGFVDGGELYVTGRIKELLILSGENIMPEDIEGPANAVTGSVSRRSAAFSITRSSQGEEAVLVMEADLSDVGRVADLERKVRLAVARALGIALLDVVFVRRGTIQRTSSGKLRRQALREEYLAGRLRRMP